MYRTLQTVLQQKQDFSLNCSLLSFSRKAKMMFGLKVKKKKKKVNTDLVLANKGALGKA